MAFQDHFSQQAKQYASSRPTYPPALAEYLCTLLPRSGRAWEAGCGSGQLTHGLARQIDDIIATDPSEAQLSNAPRLPGVTYVCSTAESSSLRDDSVDLCIAAQAAHWFDLAAYYTEVRRVSRPNAHLALISYGNMQTDDDLDRAGARFYAFLRDGGYWPAERRHVDTAYQTLDFPFDAMETPEFTIELRWSFDDFMSYVETWSAVKALNERGGAQQLANFRDELRAVWRPANEKRVFRWPIALKVGLVD